MIPVDVANQLRVVTKDNPPASAPVVPVNKLTDVLPDLVPGQRVMAEIQAQLPNGTYRAIVAQRNVTLALPFSAKPGDSLELEVTENDGKLALAVVAGQAGTKSQGEVRESVATSLSRTGKLIGELLGKIDSQGGRAPPAPLNASQPLVANMPQHAGDLAPMLKQALTQSGMFYEAHQARWAAGEFPTSSLLQEPQGQHSQLRAFAGSNLLNSPLLTASAALSPESQENLTPVGTLPPDVHTVPPENEPSSAVPIPTKEIAPGRQLEPNAVEVRAASPHATTGAGIPADLAPLVQQQLDALSTQTFAWQGQIWPGQQMHWDIERQADEQGSRSDDESAVRWRTRLKLDLPQLGGIAASLSLGPGGEIGVELATESADSEARLDGAAAQLVAQMAAAGLNLIQFSVKHGETAT